ncbi:hypothetical protein [Actinomadura litoris]|uniref:hypothetical protein n=1 Tax=Actinomadura litoris TaxID=2678616 RepID=UPI001FA7DD81|nr:hypothetical protein [Actinomadura litoris]
MTAPTAAPDLSVEIQDGQVRLHIAANETDSTLAWVRRRDPDGVLRRVRSFQGVPLQNRAAAGFDYEPPLNVPLTYVGYVTDADPTHVSPLVEVQSAAVPYTRTQLCSATAPYWKTSAPIQTMSALKRDVAYGAHYVLGRPAPITIASVRQRATFTLTIATTSAADGDALRELLNADPHLLLQGHPNEGGNLWFLCSSYAEERPVPTVAAYPDRLWSLECIGVDPPAAPLATTGKGTYADLLATLPNYAALPAAFTSYGELALWNGPPPTPRLRSVLED